MEIPGNQKVAGCSANVGVSVKMVYKGSFIKLLRKGKLHGYAQITIDDAEYNLRLLEEAVHPNELVDCYDWKRLKGNEWRDCFQIRIKPNNGKIRMRYKWKKGASQPEWVEIRTDGWK